MPRIDKLQSDLLRNDWSWDSNDSGSWPWETIRTAAAAARRLISIDQTLRAILTRLDALGNDGIHDLIRLEASRVRGRARRDKAAAKRRRTGKAKAGSR